jgi:hypothetical protein
MRAIWFVLHGYGQLAGAFVRFFADMRRRGRSSSLPRR